MPCAPAGLPDLPAAGAVARLGHDRRPLALDQAPAQPADAVPALVHADEGGVEVGEDHAGGGGELDTDLCLRGGPLGLAFRAAPRRPEGTARPEG